MTGLPDINQTFIDFKANDFRTTYNDAVAFVPAIRDVTQPDLRKLQFIRFNGNFTGFIRDFVTFGTIQTNLGILTSDLNMKLPAKQQPIYSGTIATDYFKLGDFLGDSKIGIVALNGSVKGKGFNIKTLQTDIDGKIRFADYNGYRYNNIVLKGKLDKKRFDGQASIDDPEAQLTLNGIIDFNNAEEPTFNFLAEVQKANLKKLNLTHDDLAFAGKFNLDFTGNSIDNFLGHASITDASLSKDGNPLPFELHLPNGDLLPPEQIPYIRAFARGETVIGMDLSIRKASGELLPVSASAVPIRGPQGELSGATALFRDVSAQKELERMREEWSAVIAHDLRQPVGVISLAADLVQQAHLGPAAAAKHLERIRKANRRLKEMIDDLLDVTRLESHRLTITPAKMDVAATAREVCDRIGGSCAGHVVSVRQSGSAPFAWADVGRIEQVITNLITNACKYGQAGEEIRVDVDGRADEVEVSVTNHGRGIAPDELPRVFERFMRSEKSRSSGIEGIGLGLYICKGLVEAHGGRIWVESTPGETTTFHFTLPARPGDRQRNQIPPRG